MSALVTHGVISGATAGGGGGGGGASGVIVPFILYTTAGVAVSGVDLSAAGVVKVSVNGADYVNRVGDPPVNIANRTGHYYYELDVTEMVAGDTTIVSVVIAGHQPVLEKIVIPDYSTITSAIANAVASLAGSIGAAITSINTNTNTQIDAVPTAAEIDTQLSGTHGAGSWLGATATQMRDALLDYEFRPGRTLRGHWRRMDGLFFNKVTGLLGALVTVWQPGASDVEYTAIQDPGAGTRNEVDVTESEDP